MKAAVCREFARPLIIEDISLEPPRSDEVHIKVKACAICHSDITYMDGLWGGEPPIVFGHEGAGIVLNTGDNITHVQPGDHVLISLMRSCGVCPDCESGAPYQCSTPFKVDADPRIVGSDGNKIKAGLRTGAFAEEVVVDKSQVIKIDKDVPFTSASLLSCGVITGFGAVVNTAGVTPKDSAAVIGCGGVGLNCVQGGALSGAYPLVAIDLIDSKLVNAKKFGATHIINARSENVADKTADILHGDLFDYVFVAAGSSKAIEQGVKILRKGGTLVLVGMPANGDYPVIDMCEFANNSQKLIGSKVGSSRLRTDIPKWIRLYKDGKLKLDELISNCYPLEQINHAIDEVRQDKVMRNVIVFD